MKIDDVDIPQNIMPKRLIDRLASQGFKEVGRGSFSIVMLSPDNTHVVKINIVKNTGWEIFLDWAVERQKNPYIPKIYKISKFKHNNKTYTATFMEPLLKSETLPRGMVTFCDNIEVYLNGHDPEDYMPESYASDYHHFIRSHPDLVDVLVEIEELKPYHLDMHNGNVMKRSDGHLVITDPLS